MSRFNGRFKCSSRCWLRSSGGMVLVGMGEKGVAGGGRLRFKG